MREKLIELIGQVLRCLPWGEISSHTAEDIADRLIANGVFVLPCNIGDTVYVINYCRCGKPECFDKKHCYKKETAKTPKVLASKMVQQMGWVTAWSFGGVDKEKSGWKPKGTICYRVYEKPFELKMLAEVGKTVFLTLADAEKALEEKGQTNKHFPDGDCK